MISFFIKARPGQRGGGGFLPRNGQTSPANSVGEITAAAPPGTAATASVASHLVIGLRYLILAGGDMAAKAIGFLATILVIRHFGSAGFGALNFAASIAGWAVMIASCGADVLAIQTVAVKKETVGSAASTVMVIRLIAGTIALLVLLPLCLAIPSLRAVWPLIALFGLSLFSQAVNVDWSTQALEKPVAFSLSLLANQAICLALLVTAMRLAPGGLWAVPVTQVTAEALTAAGLLFWLGRYTGRLFAPCLPVREWPALLRRAFPIGGARLMRSLALGSDIVLLGFLVPLRELGWYAGAYRVYGPGLSLGFLYFVILFPRLARKAAESDAVLRLELIQSFKRLLVVAPPILVLAMFAAGPVIQRLYDPSFAAAVLPLHVLIGSLLVSLFGNHFRQILIAQNRQNSDFKIASAASLVHVLSKLALIPLFGILGAALGTLIGETSVLLMGAWVTRSLWQARAGETYHASLGAEAAAPQGAAAP